MTVKEKTHRDYLSVIGETAATAKYYKEKRWNQYYAKTFCHVVGNMISEDLERDSVIDIGTSHGNWFTFLQSQGFRKIFGVELDPDRAQQARACGYTEVFNCDAAEIPLSDSSINLAVSNDVFVHILQMNDKANVLREVQRILKPGGCFIVNHTSSKAFGFSDYHVEKHCSFLSLHEFLKLVMDNTDFEIVDIKPTYYHWRNTRLGLVKKIFRKALALPFVVNLLFMLDFFHSRNISIDESDTIYLKLKKPSA